MKGFKIFLVVIAAMVVLSLFFATIGLPAVVGAGDITSIGTETFTNTEGKNVTDLHVTFSNKKQNVAIEDWSPKPPNSPFISHKPSEDKKTLYCANGTVRNGDSVNITFSLSGTLPIKKTWYWTVNDVKIGKDKVETITAIPKNGGNASIPLPTDEATVNFPPGALEVDTVVMLSNVLPIPNPTAVPQGFLPIIKALGIELEPNPGMLATLATVTIPYTDEEAVGYNETSLQILRYDDNAGMWHVIPSTVDTANNVVTFERDHFSIYGIGGSPPLIVELPTITSITPDHGKQGATLDVIITGTNFAGATGVSFGAGITVNSFNVDSWAQITANITIDADAPIVPRGVSVTTVGGTANLVDGFTVGKGGICFIATAAYGTPMAPQIDVLREFRDEYLLTNSVGQALVGFYYQVSLPIAEFITEHPALKPVVRAALVPAVAMSTVAVKTTLAQKIAIVSSMALVSALLIVWLKKRAGKARSAN